MNKYMLVLNIHPCFNLWFKVTLLLVIARTCEIVCVHTLLQCLHNGFSLFHELYIHDKPHVQQVVGRKYSDKVCVIAGHISAQ